MRHVQKLQSMGTKGTTRDDVLDQIAIFLAAASFAALLVATYGLDMSAGLF